MPDPIVLEMPMATISSNPRSRDKFVSVTLSFVNLFLRNKKSQLILGMISILLIRRRYLAINYKKILFNIKVKKLIHTIIKHLNCNCILDCSQIVFRPLFARN